MNHSRILALAAGLLALTVTTHATSQELWINEFHYDNVGGDVGEFVEIVVADAVTTLPANIEVVLYNGSNGSSYNTLTLDAFNVSAVAGFTIYDLAISGIQNGAPDGLALVDDGNLVQFLSYEGSFTATDGPATGVTSTDIGVSEPGSTPAGQSLQLSGSGSNYADFTWVAPATETPGALNNNQTLTGATPALNEFGISDSGADAEFFELVGPIGADLSNLDLVVLEGAAGNNPGSVGVHIDLTGTIPADGYWVATSPEADSTYSVTGDQAIADNTFANRSRTYLLVTGFTGAVTDDLDSDDDGVLDSTPWTSIEDSLAIIDDDVPVNYSMTVVGPSGTFLPAGAFRCPDGNGAWGVLDFSDENGTPGIVNECSNLEAPTVTGTDPADGDSGILPLAPLTIDFSKAVDATANAVTLECDGILQSVTGLPAVGVTQLLLTPTDPIPDGATCTATVVAGEIQDGDGNAMAEDFSWSYTILFVLTIEQIQGDGLRSTLAPPTGEGAGATVLTTGNVVTSVGANFFTIQQPDIGLPRGPGLASRGLFVFTNAAPTVVVGNEVSVQGPVFEFFNQTQIGFPDTVEVTNASVPLPAPIVFDAATPSPDPQSPSCIINNFECFESMRVTVTSGFVTAPSQSFGSDPVAEAFVTASGSRALRGSGVEFPGIDPSVCPNCPVWRGTPEVFELDPDRIGLSNPILAAGTTFSATGVIGFEFGDYELWPTELTVTSEPTLPAPVPGSVSLSIASLNALNLFDDVDDPERPIATCGAGYIADDRAVLTPAEYELKLDKLADTIGVQLNQPDIVALQEVERLTTLQDLAQRLQALRGGTNYTAYLIPGNDRGDINNGFLVNESVVAVDAVYLEGLDECLSLDDTPLHDRPVLTLEGRYIGQPGSEWPFVLMNNHLRSLSGIDNESRVRLKRHEQAQSVAAKVQARQLADPNLPVILVGDLNAFEFTDGYVDVVGLISGTAVEAQNLVNIENVGLPGFEPGNQVSPTLINPVFGLPEEARYSFIFQGVSQMLDHALLNRTANLYLLDFGFARGNVDVQEDFADLPGPLRSSDHDGFLLQFDTTRDIDALYRDRFEQ